LWQSKVLSQQIEDSNRLTKQVASYAVIGLTVLAPALGGSTELWAQASLAIATGLLLLVYPPRKSLGWIPNCLFSALLAISLIGFFPAKWFPIPQWRTDLLQLGAQLPPTRSPQPWLTLQWTSFLFLALVWSYYLAAFSWRRRRREKACVIYAVAVLCLSAALIVAFITKERVPFWPEVEQFGFFPNRNQTSNVLGLGGIMIYALALQSLQENRRYWWGWLVSLSIVCWALILNFSRAGIVLFFFGALALHLYWWFNAENRRQSLVAIGGLALLLTLFVINGGATLSRFGHETTGLLSESSNLRLPIYQDAFRLLEKSPLVGIGLGNFASVFGFNRVYSVLDKEAFHPESDWFWSAIDLGLIGPAIIFGLVCWWIKKCRPFDPGSIRLIRTGALICGCAFLAHGFFDVSGHRIGALWPALFLGSIAVHPNAEFKISKWITPLFRVFGFSLVLIGLWWMSSVFGGTTLPTTATQDQLRAEIVSAIDRNDYEAADRLSDEALEVGPLNWLAYYQRALAEVGLTNSRRAALRDFGISNYLYPFWPDLYLHQGEVWLGVGEIDLAFEVWKEGLRRTGDATGDLYARILNAAGADPEMRERLRQLIDNNHAYLLSFLGSASRFEFEIEIERLLSNDALVRSLSPNELQTILMMWYQKGNKLELAETLRMRPDWMRLGWKQLAQVYADNQDYRQAYETVAKFDPPPKLPAIQQDQPFEKLVARFQVNQNDVPNGLALYQAQLKQGQSDAALVTLQKLAAVPGSPKYLSYLEAQLWATAGQWQKAWEAVARYESDEK
jgi:hypothetical protein